MCQLGGRTTSNNRDSFKTGSCHRKRLALIVSVAVDHFKFLDKMRNATLSIAAANDDRGYHFRAVLRVLCSVCLSASCPMVFPLLSPYSHALRIFGILNLLCLVTNCSIVYCIHAPPLLPLLLRVSVPSKCSLA